MAYYYNHTDFIDFVNTNILNGELSSQTNLNKSVDILKKENLDDHNRLEILRGSYAIPWKLDTEYKEGEIVSFTTDPGLPSEVTKNYAVKAGQTAYNKIPDSEPSYWEEVTFEDYFVPINAAVMANYLAKTNTTPYAPTDDYNPATKKYVDDSVNVIYINNDPSNGLNYLPLDNTIAYTPTDDYNPATKKYVIDSITNGVNNGTITVSNANNAEKLENREASGYMTLHRDFSGNYNGMGVKNGPAGEDLNTTDWIRTTANGILPYDQNQEANLGDEQWQFKGVYAVDFYGNYNAQAADIAEIYESDKDYEPGTVLQVGKDTEVTIYNNGILAGVVSTKPGLILNNDIKGVKVALKGRIPVKINGSAKRGQYINADENGKGIACDYKTDRTIGVCIKGGEGLVEVKV